MKVIIFMTFLLVSSAVVSAKEPLAFIDGDLDGFVNRVVTRRTDKELFKKYYASLSKKMEECHSCKQKAALQYLYSSAMDNLKKKHAAWFREIEPLFEDPKYTVDETYDALRVSVRQFLRWYGAYEEYLSAKLMRTCQKEVTQVVEGTIEKRGVWNKMKSYASNVKNTVVSWFKGNEVQQYDLT